MKLIRCQKCGAMVITDESLLQNIIDAMEDANRRARYGNGAKRNAALHEAAELRTIYKGMMHNITQRDLAEYETPYVLQELVQSIKQRGMMTQAELNDVCDRGKRHAAAVRASAGKEIQRIYGQTQTIGNRSMPNPTEREALKRCR